MSHAVLSIFTKTSELGRRERFFKDFYELSTISDCIYNYNTYIGIFSDVVAGILRLRK